jgi:transcriptional antiterminator NusG
MPLLAPEPFVYPEGLFAPGRASAEGEARWWVLHTRARAEKSVARTALRQEVPFFLPLHDRRWSNKGRTFSSYLPLFPGYLFIHGNDDARQKVLDTNLVASTLHVADQERLQRDLTRVYDLMTAGIALTPEKGLAPGDRVVIVDGPMRGFEGKVARRGKHLKLIVEVEFIRCGVSVEIESWMVRPLPVREPMVS